MVGLSPSDVVNVTVNLAPIAVQLRNFGLNMILGSSNIIDVVERKRVYANLVDVQADFGTTAPEALAAQAYFSQVPQPDTVFIARWAQSATHAILHGGALTATQQLLSNFTAVTAGSFHISMNGDGGHDITGINLSSATNLNGVASLVQTALQTNYSGSTVVWNANEERFNITASGAAGTSSAITFATAAASGTDISQMMALRNGDGGNVVAGVAAETVTQAISALANQFTDWYGVIGAFDPSNLPQESDLIAASLEIEAYAPSRIAWWTYQGADALNSSLTTDLGSQVQALKLRRTIVCYSSTSPYAAASAAARMATVDYAANKSTITMKFKQMPGIVAETLTETQAATLKAKNYNYFVNYNNGASIIQEGVAANGYFVDEVINCDWFQNACQVAYFNLLYQLPKVPQTDAGTAMIVAVLKKDGCDAAVNNGFVAPGVWNGPPVGQINTGDTLPLGYYVYAPLVSSQNQSDREARKAVPIQILLKEAGAVHSGNVLVTVNR